MHSSAEFSISSADLELAAAAWPGASSRVDLIFSLVAAAIRGRKIPPGSRLPSVRQLADDCQVSRDTTARAYDKLVAHGLLESRRGSGFYALAAKRRPYVAAPSRTAMAPQFPTENPTRWRLSLVRPSSNLLTLSGSGVLPDDWIDAEQITSALRAVARSNQRVLAHHGDPQGYLPLREQLKLKLGDLGVNASTGNIITTCGATDAIHLIVQTYLRSPGHAVLVEVPGPPMLLDRLLSCGLIPIMVPRRNDGPDVEILRTLCAKHRPQFFFCNSVLHNPTSTYMAPHTAFQILRLAEEFDLTIVEDDTYGDLMPDSSAAPVARLAPLDQLQRVIYVGSFSKTLAPGLRCGFLVANQQRIDWLLTYRAISQLAINSWPERVVYRLLSEGNYRHHCKKLRQRLSEARSPLIQQLRSMGLQIDNEPDVGLYVWADLGSNIDAQSVAERMLEQGHLIAPGVVFSPEPMHKSFVRFNIGHSHESPALPALAKLLGRRCDS
jgi:DNA-binding transcriptional MocR family regulator